MLGNDNREHGVVITLVPASGPWLAPSDRRLARLLKASLRQYGWRCVGLATSVGQPLMSSHERDPIGALAPRAERR